MTPTLTQDDPVGFLAEERVRTHLAAIALLGVVLILRYWHWLTFPEAINDELVYVRAFLKVRAGESPFAAGGYFYPPFVAYAGAWLGGKLSDLFALGVFRVANVLGVAVTLWISVAWLRLSTRARWGIAAAIGCLSPGIHFGFFVANLSLAVGGMVTYGLTLWSRRPATAGLAIGSSLAIKPLAPLAALLLPLHRPNRSGGNRFSAALWRRAVWATVVAALAAVALLVPFPHLFDMPTSPPGGDSYAKTISPHRLAQLVGLGSAMWAVTAGVAVLALVWVRRRTLEPKEFCALAAVATLAATPILWSHSLLPILPLQVWAVALAFDRWRARPRTEQAGSLWRRYELGLVLLAVVALQFSTGASTIDDRAPFLQWVGSALPILAPWLLLVFVLRCEGVSPLVPSGNDASRP